LLNKEKPRSAIALLRLFSFSSFAQASLARLENKKAGHFVPGFL
jgi:hypothetical protein